MRGVRAVANDIAVRLKLPRTDAEIARDAAFALNLRDSVPRAVKAIVHNGHITLTGPVDWMFQTTQAEKLVRHIPGVVGVMNHIEVMPRAADRDIQKRIVHALHRSADVNAKQIEVKVDGDVVTLTGTVGSWLQREAAERAAGSAPGIRHVDNRDHDRPDVRSRGSARRAVLTRQRRVIRLSMRRGARYPRAARFHGQRSHPINPIDRAPGAWPVHARAAKWLIGNRRYTSRCTSR